MAVRISPLAAAGLLALAGVNISLLILISGDIAPETYASSGPIERTPSLSAAAEGIPNPKAIEAYAQTLAHPVFFKTREPFVATPKPVPSPAAVPGSPPAPAFVDPGLVLGGVLINGRLGKAYLFHRTNPDGAWVTQGDSFAGWKVTTVEAGRARLEKDGHLVDLQLYPE
jgi:hypothetical protein